MPQPVTYRFAPSPSGLLHLGHAYSALLNADAAAREGGLLRLRIEDIDKGRCRPAFEEAIYEDLAWLGITWAPPVLRQSDRFGIYESTLAGLAEKGLVYRCFKTRAELRALANAPHGPSAKGALTAPLPAAEEDALLARGAPFAWRLNARRAAEALGAAEIGWHEDTEDGLRMNSAPLDTLSDEVLGRKDFPASYHLASVVDDGAQNITYVLRGEDLRDAIPLHRLLQDLLGLPAPVYSHHRLITDDQGRRLAKRDKAATLRALRDEGVRPQDIRLRLGLPPASC